MPCFHPLKGFILGLKENGKKDILIRKYTLDHLEVDKGGKVYDCLDSTRVYANTRIVNEYVDIPCGHCLGCRLDYARMWTSRLLCELETQRDGAESYFVTFTYDNEYLPLSFAPDGNPIATLCYADFQKFMKRLRKEVKKICPVAKVRYFVASEYGSSTYRPHFHAILFDCPIPDKQVFSRKKGEVFYVSLWLERIWKFGHILIGSVTPASCGYVARYCTKKVFGQDKEFFDTLDLTPECVHMSTNPGIGKKWLELHPDVLEYSTLSIKTEKGGKKYCIPKYFMVKLGEDSTEQNKKYVELLKEQRLRYFHEKRDLSNRSSSKTYLERLQDMESSLINKFNKEREINEP